MQPNNRPVIIRLPYYHNLSLNTIRSYLLKHLMNPSPPVPAQPISILYLNRIHLVIEHINHGICDVIMMMYSPNQCTYIEQSLNYINSLHHTLSSSEIININYFAKIRKFSPHVPPCGIRVFVYYGFGIFQFN